MHTSYHSLTSTGDKLKKKKNLIISEASKVIMQYVAAVSGKGKEIDRVKEQLLQSNPVLEGKDNNWNVETHS